MTANLDSDDLSVLLGIGDGSFQAAVSIPVDIPPGGGFPPPREPTNVLVADVDLDDALDIVTVTRLGNDTSVRLGNGDGSFQAALFVPMCESADPVEVAVSDLDGDTLPDLLASCLGDDAVGVALGSADGGYLPVLYFPTSSSPNKLAVADLDLDTVPDLAVTGSNVASVSILLNQ